MAPPRPSAFVTHTGRGPQCRGLVAPPGVVSLMCQRSGPASAVC